MGMGGPVFAVGTALFLFAEFGGGGVQLARSGGGDCGPIGAVATDTQIACLATNAGFPEWDVPNMVRIANAESSGRIGASHYSPEDGSWDYGLMEVNSKHGYDTYRLMHDPAYNMWAAKQVYDVQGKSGWSTWNNGAARG